MNNQRTISKLVEISAPGLFSGDNCHMRFLPAEVGSGVAFVRTGGDAGPVRIPCDVANLIPRPRRTALEYDGQTIETVEHVLSAVAGLGIDNLTIECDSSEAPSLDGSPLPFVDVLQNAGIVEQDAQRKVFAIDEPIVVSEGEASVSALPGPTDRLEIIYELDYSETPAIGKQVFSFCLGSGDYAREIAPARTFLLADEAEALRAQGVGAHLTERDIVVFGPDGVIDNELRFDDEPVRHKLADLIGDLAVVGIPLAGRIVACRSGHELNQVLARSLSDAINSSEATQPAPPQAPVMDIRKVMEILPHRYPFLMIDRVIEMDAQRAVAVKNVTINEPFFQGHYPDQPIMPGVLTLEAMAQLSGLLLSQQLERGGKVAVLLSMDRVKMRRPVRPGDQLVLEAEAIRVRPRMGHCRCRALVDNELAAEAEIKFMLVDAEPV